MKKSIVILCLVLTVFLFPNTEADPMDPEDIVLSPNGYLFKYEDHIVVEIWADPNTTYRMYVEEKEYNMKIQYIRVETNETGYSQQVWQIDKIRYERPGYYYVFLKLENVSYPIGFDIEVRPTIAQIWGEVQERDHWFVSFVMEFKDWILLIVIVSILSYFLWRTYDSWVTHRPTEVIYGDPFYDTKLGKYVTPVTYPSFFHYTWARMINFLFTSKRRIRQFKKSVGTPYDKNVRGDEYPLEKERQYRIRDTIRLTRKENNLDGLKRKVNLLQHKIKGMEDEPPNKRDTKAIRAKENKLKKLITKRDNMSEDINNLRDKIDTRSTQILKLEKTEMEGDWIC